MRSSIQVYEGDGSKPQDPIPQPAFARFEVGLIRACGVAFNVVQRETLAAALADAWVLFADSDVGQQAVDISPAARAAYNKLRSRICRINSARSFRMSQKAPDGVNVFIRRYYV